VQCRPPDRPRARWPASPHAGSVTDDDRRQPAKQHWLIRRASNNSKYTWKTSNIKFCSIYQSGYLYLTACSTCSLALRVSNNISTVMKIDRLIKIIDIILAPISIELRLYCSNHIWTGLIPSIQKELTELFPCRTIHYQVIFVIITVPQSWILFCALISPVIILNASCCLSDCIGRP